ncbi:MAG TPA: class I adenylate-forming enzyme family protein, partial [Ilumatobacteraceae bacterium]
LLGRARGARSVRGSKAGVTNHGEPPQTLADYLWHWERTSPDRLLTSDAAGARYTYAEAGALTRALAAEFAGRGLTPGDRVAVLAENSSVWIITFLAAIGSGLVAVPLATRLTTTELDAILDDARPAVIAVDDAMLKSLSDRWRERVLRLSQPLPADGSGGLLSDARGDAPACLTYTSGTTGRPKGVLLSNEGMVRASLTYAALFHSTPASHTIVAVPLCHNTGFVDQIGHMLAAGGSIEAHRRFDAGAIAAALTSGACTYFIGVPTMYQRIADHLGAALACAQSPWLAFGGAPMGSRLITRLHELFPQARLANCYGLSEATSITHINFLSGDSSATDVGAAVPGTIDRISASGELLVRSPTTMLGYHGDPAATQAKFEDGWLRTGDIATRSDDGIVRVLGRVDDLINRGGEKVIPHEVEEALSHHPSIVEAAVVGMPDDHFGSIVAAAVVTREPVTHADLQRFLQDALADYKRPSCIAFVDQLPRNENGKVIGSDVRDVIERRREAEAAQQ